MKVAFFGGTFDPPHLGHLGEARAALTQGAADLVLFVPAYAPPHKPGRRIAPFEDRVRMLEAALENESGMAISRIEAELRLVPSYTVKIMAELARRHPDWQLKLLIGGDSLAQLHDWYRAEELVRRWDVITFPRRGETPDLAELARQWPPELAEKLAAGILQGEFFEISSTMIRKKLANGENPATVIPEKVWLYIKQHRLYAGEAEGGHPQMEEVKKPTPQELADFCVKLAEDKLAENVLALDVIGKTSITDFFVIATVTSQPHLTALSSHLERAVREKFKIRVLSHGDAGDSGWTLLDFGMVIVHLMLPEVRDRYGLENLWGGRPRQQDIEKLESAAGR